MFHSRHLQRCVSFPRLYHAANSRWWERTGSRVHQIKRRRGLPHAVETISLERDGQEKDSALRTSPEPATTASRHASKKKHRYAIPTSKSANNNKPQHRMRLKAQKEGQKERHCGISGACVCASVCNEVWWRPCPTNLHHQSIVS